MRAAHTECMNASMLAVRAVFPVLMTYLHGDHNIKAREPFVAADRFIQRRAARVSAYVRIA